MPQHPGKQRTSQQCKLEVAPGLRDESRLLAYAKGRPKGKECLRFSDMSPFDRKGAPERKQAFKISSPRNLKKRKGKERADARKSETVPVSSLGEYTHSVMALGH